MALAMDGWRSFTSLQVDGWLAISTLLISAVALAPFMSTVHEADAGNVWMFFYLVAFVRLFQVEGIQWPWLLLQRHVWLCGLLLMTLLSTLWSEHPDVSLNRSVSLMGTTLLAICAGELLSQRRLMQAWMWALTLLIGGSLAVYLFAPELSQLWVTDWAGRYRGLGTGKNQVGPFLALGATLFTAATLRGMIDRSLGVALTAMYVAAAIFAESTTSLLSLTAGIGAIAGIAVTRTLGLSAPTVFWLMGAGTSLLVAFAIAEVESFTSLFDKQATLSGRTELWAASLEMLTRQPLLGFGHSAIWNRPETNDFLNAFASHDFEWSQVVHAHNGFINIATDLGIPAAVLMAAYVIRSLVWAVQAFLRDGSSFPLFSVGFLSSFIVMNIGEPFLLRSRSGMWIVFVAITVALARERAHRRRAPRRVPDEPVPPLQAETRPRPALPAREDGAAGSTPPPRQLENAPVRRDGDRWSRSGQLRSQFHEALVRLDPERASRLAGLREQLRSAIRRHDGHETSARAGSQPLGLRKPPRGNGEDPSPGGKEDGRSSASDQPDRRSRRSTRGGGTRRRGGARRLGP